MTSFQQSFNAGFNPGFNGGPDGATPGTPVLLSIVVTPAGATFVPDDAADRQQMTAIGTYSSGPDQDITATVTWVSGTPATATIASDGQVTAVTARNGTDGAATTTLITATLGAISGNTTLSIDVARDATDGKRYPINAYQLTTLLGIPATSLRLFNETSGNLLDHIGAKPLTPNASPSYDQPIAGLDRNGIAFTGVTAQRLLDSAYGDSATTSMLVMARVGYTGAPGNSLTMLGYGQSNDALITSGSAGQQTFRYRQLTNINQMAGTYTAPTIYPLSFRRNITAGTALMASDTEKIVPTFGASTGQNFGYGAITGGLSATVVFVHAIEVLGAGAEMSDAVLKGHWQALGETITWT